ncbi:MAG: type IIL restriction-modification enzyme MmeI [Xanthomonadaceae bacterium]|nr:type IIL restriction-modification enzyme MmeI [Xanthomonadaceae bacterium]
MTDNASDAVEGFIAKWADVKASELSTSQSFLADLCRLLDVATPHPTAEQDYMFERPITFRHGDGSTSPGRIDLYRRGAFVLESKKLKADSRNKGFDEAMLRARSQAENYARALPASEGRPPFVVVVDVGHRIELYSEFSRSGATYTPYPDPRSHRIALADLRRDAIRDRLRRVWSDPLSLDPSRESARVTRDIAARLANLARSLEQAGHDPEVVAQFLMRCLFTMFAEDVCLLPHDSFRNLLQTHAEQPDIAMRMLAQLWRDMDSGGFSAAIASNVLHFNGKLFKQPGTLPLDSAQLALLINAARADWQHVEPAIFGTLLERALEPSERHKLGAHYTPRAYVERLVLPTVMEPLRAQWGDAQAAALTLAAEDKHDQAVAELRRFHHHLCNVRVLDPACGSGNFLYVTLEHLKRLEGEVLNALDELGFRQTDLAIGGERADAMAGETVDPHQLLGIELNPRAAAIAEVVLWIGYLQWHFRTRGDARPPQPVIRDFRNIECRDAVLACERIEYVRDEHGVPVTRWDGITTKASPVTGEPVPDDSARVPIERYVNPRKAAWPQADYVVGNPPFLGKGEKLRFALGDGYVEALRSAWPEVPESADFVMYWWHSAAQLTQTGALQRFGFITTNSIRQTFNRRVIEAALQPTPRAVEPLTPRERGRGEGSGRAKDSAPRAPSSGAARHLLPAGEGKAQPLSLLFAIPDHPWVDASDGAAVRIAMTVAGRGAASPPGRLSTVESESEGDNDETLVVLREQHGVIHADLRVGAAVARAGALRSNGGITSMGVMLAGSGFIVDRARAIELGLRGDSAAAVPIREYRNGRDLTQSPRDALVIDLYGLSAEHVRERFPAIYQHVLERVKPERDANRRDRMRLRWWLFAECRPNLRAMLAGQSRFIATVETSKHRYFVFLSTEILPDHRLICWGLADGLALGVLSSSVHVSWALAAGGTLEDRPVYNKTRCFDPFPFPAANDEQKARIGELAEQLDALRKTQQAAHPDLTLTGIYNVLEKLRSGEPLSAKERGTHEQGLVSVLRQLHDELDAAVLDAYGWSDLLPLLRVAMGNRSSNHDSHEPSPPTPLPAGEGSEQRSLHSIEPLSLRERGRGEGGQRRSLPKAALPQDVIDFARSLRRSQTDAEGVIWYLLRNRNLHGMKFRRQHPQPPYTLDFYCHELGLAVELDGSQHADSARDVRRDAVLADAGIEVLRYWNHDVLTRTEAVLEDLYWQIEARMSDDAVIQCQPASVEKSLNRDDARRAFDEAVLERLVALNAERAAEEARGQIRWLRPEFQNPEAQQAPQQGRMPTEAPDDEAAPVAAIPASKPKAWPKDAIDQVRAVAEVLASSPIALSVDEIAARFSARGQWKKRLPPLLDMLVALGRAQIHGERYTGVR